MPKQFVPLTGAQSTFQQVLGRIAERNELFPDATSQLDRLTERWVADHLQKGKNLKKRQRTRHS
jgi:hypothetical protein